jgi:outer membrane protein insertion porin family
MKNLLFALIATICTFSSVTLMAQSASDSIPTMVYEKPKDFEVGGVRVSGAKFSDENSIIAISGLKVGSKIKIPGHDIPRAIKALWKLKLFTDVEIIKDKTVGDVVFFEIVVKERSNMSTYSFKGVKKGDHEDLTPIVNRYIQKGTIVTLNNVTNATRGIENFYKEKGYLDAVCTVQEVPDAKRVNAVKLVFDINKKSKVKIYDITFVGNTSFTSSKLRGKMDKTHRKRKLFSSSKLVKEGYEEDKKAIEKFYASKGYRDAKIESDTISRNENGDLVIAMKISEGRKYYFRNIAWKGNSIYDQKTLANVLGINKGDTYNQELLDTRLRFSQDGRDISSLYMDYGYLFFNVDPTEVAIVGDSIDLEMRIFEGPQATIDKVTIKGNDRTHEHVIRRELRTLPGEKFSRQDIIRSQREIINLGYFNQEALGINTPVNPQRGTVDIEYKLEEKPSDQLELSAGWGGYGVVGTLGVSFNNFSLRNIFKKSSWSPLPQGDGQRLSLRAQSNGSYYQSYTASFTEPWLGGKKPNAFSASLAYSKYSNGLSLSSTNSLGILQGSVSLGRRLKWPDDNFVSSTSLEYQKISIDNYPFFTGTDGNTLALGTFNSLSLSQTFIRNSISNPQYPDKGSKISLTLQASAPYSSISSLFGDNTTRYKDLSDQDKFKWIEFYKWKIGAEWYTALSYDKKLVLKAAAKMGSLGYYNKDIGYSLFGRYVVGGDGLANRQVGLTGKELIALRGYTNADIQTNAAGSGGIAFAKYTTELRYALSLNPSSMIYVLAFAEAGNEYASAKEFNPFNVRKAAGMGLRVFLPMFGTLGFDYGVGFDKPDLDPVSTTWSGYGKFSIILGFEPE